MPMDYFNYVVMVWKGGGNQYSNIDGTITSSNICKSNICGLFQLVHQLIQGMISIGFKYRSKQGLVNNWSWIRI